MSGSAANFCQEIEPNSIEVRLVTVIRKKIIIIHTYICTYLYTNKKVNKNKNNKKLRLEIKLTQKDNPRCVRVI